MIVFLIGYMGSGKSTVGKNLAKKLNFSYVDLDTLIEKEEHTTIDEIFINKGEEQFRALESHYLNKIANTNNLIVSLGGGTPCFNNNMELIKQKGKSVYLKMTPAALVNRLKNANSNRPLIKNKNELELKEYIDSTLAIREKFYLQADYVVNGLNLKIEELIETIK